MEALDVLCVSRSRKSSEYVNKVNSYLLEQTEMAREEEAGTIIGQKRSYEEELSPTTTRKVRITQYFVFTKTLKILWCMSSDDHLFI